MDINSPLSFRQLPPVVRSLLVVCVALFLGQLVAPQFLATWLGLTPALVLRQGWVWQLVTFGFLHGGWFHLLFNLFLLWTLGRELERTWGSRGFLAYYLACGVGAGLLNVALAPQQMVPTVGASGSIFGLLTAIAVLHPDAVFYMYFLIPIRARVMMILLAVIEFVAGASGGGSSAAHWAHLGGMVVGWLILVSRPLWRLLQAFSRPRRPRSPGVRIYELGSEVDRILDKISARGLDSLTSEERDLMDRYGRSRR